jgi:hypothetical protein
LDITHFFQSIPDKLGNLIVPSHILETLVIMKTAIILITLALLISSIALLILALSHHRSKKSFKPINPNSSPPALPK